MSSSPSSSSSSSLALASTVPQPAAPHGGLDRLRDVVCPVSVVLGSGSISVRRVLAMDRQHIIRLHQLAGEDLQMFVNGVLVARGEVVVVEDSTAIRLTEIARPLPGEK
jgi:flagellar motor switch protein FliN/FliY